MVRIFRGQRRAVEAAEAANKQGGDATTAPEAASPTRGEQEDAANAQSARAEDEARQPRVGPEAQRDALEGAAAATEAGSAQQASPPRAGEDSEQAHHPPSREVAEQAPPARAGETPEQAPHTPSGEVTEQASHARAGEASERDVAHTAADDSSSVLEQGAGSPPSTPDRTGDGDTHEDEQARGANEPAAKEPGFLTRSRMRRRARFLRAARELAYRDLGGLVFDMHRFEQRNDEVVKAKLATLRRIDTELRGLEEALRERPALTVLRQAGVAACPRCAAIHGSGDRFCPACGLQVSQAERPITGAPAPSAPVSQTGYPPPYVEQSSPWQAQPWQHQWHQQQWQQQQWQQQQLQQQHWQQQPWQQPHPEQAPHPQQAPLFQHPPSTPPPTEELAAIFPDESVERASADPAGDDATQSARPTADSGTAAPDGSDAAREGNRGQASSGQQAIDEQATTEQTSGGEQTPGEQTTREQALHEQAAREQATEVIEPDRAHPGTRSIRDYPTPAPGSSHGRA